MFRKFFITCSCLVFIGLFLSFFPNLFSSTSWGKEFILKFFNERIPGSITTEEMRINWLGNQCLKQVSWQSSDGQTKLQCEILTIDINLFQCLRAYFDKQIQGTMTIQNLSSSSNSLFINNLKEKYYIKKLPQNFQISAHCLLDRSKVIYLKDFHLYAWFPNISKPMHVYSNSLDIPL